MCVWHSGDMPRSTKVCASGVAQKRQRAREAGAACPWTSARFDRVGTAALIGGSTSELIVFRASPARWYWRIAGTRPRSERFAPATFARGGLFQADPLQDVKLITG